MGHLPGYFKSVVAIVAIVIVVFAFSGTDESGAHRTLFKNGWSQYTMHGFDWLGCNLADWYRTRFFGVSPAGVPTWGTVCGSPWAGSYVRVD